MAYDDDKTTLSTFDINISDEVFYQMTSITLDQFLFMRGCCSYTDAKTGEDKRVIPESYLIWSYLMILLENSLQCTHSWANHFDQSHTNSIFDYIPQQKTNQIFTPKSIVKQKSDLLNKLNSY